jgi:hypothetical protein
MKTKICKNSLCFKEYTGDGWSGRFCSQACAIEQLERNEQSWKRHGRTMVELGKTPVPSFVPAKGQS